MIRDSLQPSDQERLLELLADQAIFGLDSNEQAELDALIQLSPDVPTDEMERIATLLELSALDSNSDSEIPEGLREQILSRGKVFFAEQGDAEKDSVVVGSAKRGAGAPNPEARADRSQGPLSTGPRDRLREWGGWLAMAACLAIAAFAFSNRGGSAPSVAELRSKLVAMDGAGADLVRIDWQPTDDAYATNASGDVVWSDARQEGYMRFVGLPKNDPAVEQYQLWIFDAKQDARYPIDGGVFDINDLGETVVAIDPKIKVTNATMFAVTIEKPGGVVVSSRKRLPLLAKVES